MTVIFKLRDARIARNKTQQELADLVGISRQAVNNLEIKGAKGELGLIRVKNLDRICKVLGIRPGDLLEFVPDYEPENKE